MKTLEGIDWCEDPVFELAPFSVCVHHRHQHWTRRTWERTNEL
jgi:hypothetical protein